MNSRNVCISCMREMKENESVCPKCGFNQRSYRPPAYVLPPCTILHGKYLIGKVLGVGGFGITYIAKDMTLEHLVAVKEFFVRDTMERNASMSGYIGYSEMTPSQETVFAVNRARFEEEAKILAELSEIPEVVRVQDYFTENNTYYIVMEYLSGKTLREYVRERGGRISLKDLQMKLDPVFSAMELVHRHRILHRDISPDNMKVIDSGINKGRVKIFDFGGAIWADRQRINGDQVVILKKDGYSPPEQIRSETTQGPWTDVYQMAATMYYCLCGTAPASAQDREKDPKSFQTPSQLSAGLPPKVEAVLLHALDMDPKKRYSSMKAFQAALTEAGWGKETVNPVPPKPPKPAKHRKGLLAVVLIVAAVIAGGLYWSNNSHKKPVLPVTRNGAAAYLSPRDGQEISLKENQESIWLWFETNITNITEPSVVTVRYETNDLDVGEAEKTSSGDVRFPLYVKERSEHWNRVKFVTADGTELTYVDVQTGGSETEDTEKVEVSEITTEKESKSEEEENPSRPFDFEDVSSETEQKHSGPLDFFKEDERETEKMEMGPLSTPTPAPASPSQFFSAGSGSSGSGSSGGSYSFGSASGSDFSDEGLFAAGTIDHSHAISDQNEAVARIGDDYFKTLSQAITDCGVGETIEIVKDLKADRSITTNKKIKIKFGDHAYSYTGSGFGIKLGGTIQIYGGRFDGNVFAIRQSGKVTMEGALLNGCVQSDGKLQLSESALISADMVALRVTGGEASVHQTQIACIGSGSGTETEASANKTVAVEVFAGASIDISGDSSITGSGTVTDLVNLGNAVIQESTLSTENGTIVVNSNNGTLYLEEVTMLQKTGDQFYGLVNSGTAKLEITSGTYPFSIHNCEEAELNITDGTFGNEKEYGLINRAKATILGGNFDLDALGRGIVNVSTAEVHVEAPLSSGIVRQTEKW